MQMNVALKTAFALCAIALTTLAKAGSCVDLSYAELKDRLDDISFPMALLSKARVADLRAFDDFYECLPNSGIHEVASLYASRRSDPVAFETVYLTAYEFSDATSRETAMKMQLEGDASAIGHLQHDIFYYVAPASLSAFRVERRNAAPND